MNFLLVSAFPSLLFLSPRWREKPTRSLPGRADCCAVFGAPSHLAPPLFNLSENELFKPENIFPRTQKRGTLPLRRPAGGPRCGLRRPSRLRSAIRIRRSSPMDQPRVAPRLRAFVG
jgi:hypothetical protein